MARSRSRRSSPRIKARAAAGRDVRYIARRRYPSIFSPTLPLRRPRLVPVEDRRLYRASTDRLLRDDLRPATVKVAPPTKRVTLSPRITFADARRVRLCQKRQERRRVIFAKGIGGSKGIRRRRTNDYTHIKCAGAR